MTYGVFIQRGKGLPTLACWRETLKAAQVVARSILDSNLTPSIFQIEWPDDEPKGNARSDATGAVQLLS
jgi:hypothetical protein